MPSLAPRRLPPLRSMFARRAYAAVRPAATAPVLAARAPTAEHHRAYASAPPAASSSSSSPSTSSVNAEEISHFSRLSAQWWDEHGELALLHKMNPSRLAFLRQKLEESARRFGSTATEAGRPVRGGQWLEGLKVLDVGCGAGLLSESLARLGGQTLGVDATPSNIPLARTHALLDPVLASPAPGSTSGAARLEYRHQTAEDLLEAEGEARFDLVCAMEVLEHVDDPKGFLLNLTKLVKVRPSPSLSAERRPSADHRFGSRSLAATSCCQRSRARPLPTC
jgi:ubiquinone biosynthesis O-methyltransferase